MTRKFLHERCRCAPDLCWKWRLGPQNKLQQWTREDKEPFLLTKIIYGETKRPTRTRSRLNSLMAFIRFDSASRTRWLDFPPTLIPALCSPWKGKFALIRKYGKKMDEWNAPSHDSLFFFFFFNVDKRIFQKYPSLLYCIGSEWKMSYHNFLKWRIKTKIHETCLGGMKYYPSSMGGPKIPQVKRKMSHFKKVKISLLPHLNKWFTFWMENYQNSCAKHTQAWLFALY